MSSPKARRPLYEDSEANPDFTLELVEPKRPPQIYRSLMRSGWALRKRYKKRYADYVFSQGPRAMRAYCLASSREMSIDLVQEV